MEKRQFEREISKIQKFLDMNDWDFSFRFQDDPGFAGEITSVDYKRFQAHFTFDSKLLKDSDDMIRKVIMHEISHIFTIMNLRQFSDDEFLKNNLGWNAHAEVITRMDILNEQMTVRLERIFSKFYKK